tara:strand:- start:78 stop:470 length:393 start_codon:yes stop_codon:yes gene_type:complete
MAHFAKLDQDNIVTTINVVHDNELLVDGAENEQKGINFLNTFFNTSDNWKQTSYNTFKGVHKLGGTPFRKNYAGIGDTYNEDKDAFIPPQPYSSWTLNNDTCQWEAPVAYPDDDKDYKWNEAITNWEEIT